MVTRSDVRPAQAVTAACGLDTARRGWAEAARAPEIGQARAGGRRLAWARRHYSRKETPREAR